MSPRKLVFLAVSLVFLAGVSGWLWLHGRPATPAVNPLEKINLDKVSRLVIQNPDGKITLEKSGDRWNMTEPIQDAADINIPEDILVSLKNFTLGTLVSENPAKHSQFSVAEGQGAHLQVYLAGESKPVLDARLGKTAGGYETCYFRFEASTPVYIANNLAEYEFKRDPKSFRLMKALPVPKGDPLEFTFVQGQRSFDLVRTSETWTTKPGGKTATAFSVNVFLNKLQSLTAADFGTGQETPAMLGFEQPYLKATLQAGGQTNTLILGKKFPQPKTAANAKTPGRRYGRMEGRPYTLLIPEDAIVDLLSSYPVLP